VREFILGKGVTRRRLDGPKAFFFGEEVQALLLRIGDVPVDENFLDLALRHNLAVYDANYLSLAQLHKLPLATVVGKLRDAAITAGVQVIRP
jgi:predicted nucleic acid-binding protein